MTNPQVSRKRWRIALAVVVLLAALGGLMAFSGHKQNRAIQEIEQLGGRVGTETFGPQWLRQWGIKFDRVTFVFLEGTEITDSGLEHLKGLTNLEWLDLHNTKVSDAGLVLEQPTLCNITSFMLPNIRHSGSPESRNIGGCSGDSNAGEDGAQ